MLARAIAGLLICAAGFAQDPRFSATSPLVLVPVEVTDKAGKTVEGLTQADFVLSDRGKPQKFEMESTFAPIALVVAIQSSVISGPALAKIQKIGSMIQPLIAGARGQAAILTYSDHVTLRQDFTGNAGKIVAAFRGITPDGDGAAMHDAVLEGVAMLASRPPSRRRVLIVIGEAKDRSSEVRLQAVVSRAQHANVVIYPVSYSVYGTSFTSKGAEEFTGGQHVYQPGGGLDLIGVFSEIGRLGQTNGGEALAKYTGGLRVSFTKLKGLEEVMQKIGDDLHTQYLLSFQSSDLGEGYRELEVRVPGKTGVQVRSRPGYWHVSD